ncbi:unnamed protein product [Lymnaea stagnalis]|uniref:Uncharacterized protein n=1 Tax=Lymnaea stagnalis TaxID=6523 RepID=A0AAV2HTB3_LYMST
MAETETGDFSKSSLRVNVLEKKRLEQIVQVYENAKRNLAIDMRRSQTAYRRKLKLYRDRKREILTSRSSSSPPTSSMGEFLIGQGCTHKPQSSRSGITHRSRPVDERGRDLTSRETVSSLKSHQELPTPAGLEDTKVFKSKLTAYLPDNHPDSSHKPGSSSSDWSRSSSDPVTRHSHSSTNATVSKVRLKLGSLESTHSFSTSPAPGHKSKVQINQSPSLEITITDLNRPSTQHAGRIGGKPRESSLLPSIPRSTGFLRDEDREQEDYEASHEMGKMSNRQRSKLDLRPRTAWALLHGNTMNGQTRISAGHKGYSSPVLLLNGSLADKNRQVRYFDKDELEERGTMYNYFLKGRLQREHTRFEDICHKIQSFCHKPPSPEMS